MNRQERGIPPRGIRKHFLDWTSRCSRVVEPLDAKPVGPSMYIDTPEAPIDRIGMEKTSP